MERKRNRARKAAGEGGGERWGGTALALIGES